MFVLLYMSIRRGELIMLERRNKELEQFFLNQYINSEIIVKYVAIDLGIKESEFIKIIENVDDRMLNIIKDSLYRLYIEIMFLIYQVK